jgi:uncharacterized membrane protein YczE
LAAGRLGGRQATGSSNTILVIAAAVFVLAVVVSFITPLQQLDDYFKEYSQPYTTLTLGMLVVGFATLVPMGHCHFGSRPTDERG